MKKRILIFVFLLSFLIISTVGITSYIISYKSHINILDENLLNYCDSISQNIDKVGDFDRMTPFRVTLIDFDGTVIYDKFTEAEIQNHKYRPEIQEAMEKGIGKSERFSTTNQVTYRYIAKKYDDVVIRTAVENSELNAIKKNVINYIILAFVLSIFLSVLIGFLAMNYIFKPIKTLTGYIEGEEKDIKYYKLPEDIRNVASSYFIMKQKNEENLEKISNSNLYLKNVINSMEDGFIAIDKQGDLTLINKKAKKIYQVEDADIYGKNILAVTNSLQIYNRISKNKITIMEEEIDNNTYKITLSPVLDMQNEGNGNIIILTDITKTREVEKIRQEFVSNVTHELKTPLTSIRGFIDTLKGGALEDKNVADRFLEIIDIEAIRLNNLIEDILSLSKIETAKSEMENDKINIRELALEVKTLIEKQAADKNIDIQIEIPDEIFIKGDRNKLKQLFINLMDNGIKYNNENSELKVNAIFHDNKIKITFKDKGIGISKEDITRIFERFYKVDKGRAKQPASTGLGLSIVKHLVELYNGTIEVNSVIGEGSSFEVTLPIERINGNHD